MFTKNVGSLVNKVQKRWKIFIILLFVDMSKRNKKPERVVFLKKAN